MRKKGAGGRLVVNLVLEFEVWKGEPVNRRHSISHRGRGSNILDNEPELPELSAAAFQKIGRNVFYQREIEGRGVTLFLSPAICRWRWRGGNATVIYRALRVLFSKFARGRSGHHSELAAEIVAVIETDRHCDAGDALVGFLKQLAGSPYSEANQVLDRRSAHRRIKGANEVAA